MVFENPTIQMEKDNANQPRFSISANSNMP
jgi:hypothetical protein